MRKYPSPKDKRHQENVTLTAFVLFALLLLIGSMLGGCDVLSPLQYSNEYKAADEPETIEEFWGLPYTEPDFMEGLNIEPVISSR